MPNANSTPFSEVRFDPRTAAEELSTFSIWLTEQDEFGETQVVTELRARTHLCLLIGAIAGIGLPNLYKHELSLAGKFRADLVVGSSQQKHFVFVEFEAGYRDSIFKRQPLSRRYKDWGNSIQHAFGQISDWCWVRSDLHNTSLDFDTFGTRNSRDTYLIICGRSDHLDQTHRDRLMWRSNNTTVGAAPILFWTFDDLCRFATAWLEGWRSAFQA